MRKWISVLFVVFIAIVGIGLAATYEAPEFEIFLFNQKIDQDLYNSKYQIGITKEEILNQLQPTISELIAKGQTYDQSADLTETFTSFNEKKEQLTVYVEDVGPEIDELIRQLNFKKVEQRVNLLAQDHQSLAKDLIQYQQERLDLLLALNAQLDQLDELLVSFNEMFYGENLPSKTLLYFQNIVYLFEEVEAIHKDYIMVTEKYQQTKTDYFLILVNMGLREYFFGR